MAPAGSKKRSRESMTDPKPSDPSITKVPNSKKKPSDASISKATTKSKGVSSTSSTPTGQNNSPPSISLPPRFPVQYPTASQTPQPSNRKQISGGSQASSQTARRAIVATLQPPQPLSQPVINPNPAIESESESSDSSDGEDADDEARIADGPDADIEEGLDNGVDEGAGGLDGYQPQNHHSAATHMTLEDLLAMPGRSNHLQTLSTVEGEGIW